MVKMQMFTVDMVPQNLRRNYIGPKRAKIFFEFAKSLNIDLFFSCMYPKAIDICNDLGVKYHKTRFYDRNNLILYRKLKKGGQDLFVSCQEPKDTIFYNMSQYQKRVKFLYCVPQYPAITEDYVSTLWKPDLKIIKGLSDHTPNLDLFKKAKETTWCDYFEMHVCFKKEGMYEANWSKSFEQLKEVLK